MEIREYLWKAPRKQFFFRIFRRKLHKRELELDMWFTYERKAFQIQWAFFRWEGMIRFMGKWVCINPYPP